MRLKNEGNPVSLKGVRPETIVAMHIADMVHQELFGSRVTITAVTDGVHSAGSLHYVGLAFDIRTRSIEESKIPVFVEALKKSLTGEFDVITEGDHIHVEFQPKH